MMASLSAEYLRILHTTFLVCLTVFAGMGISHAQAGFYLPEGRKQMDIPFEYTNNFIILNLTFNEMLPLKFILDTGAEHTILTKRELSDLLRLKYQHQFKVAGTDLTTELIAYLVRQVRFDVPMKMTAPQEDILVLEEDYFRFEEYAGVTIQGILAATSLSKFYIRINYDRRIITLYTQDNTRWKSDGFVPVPVEIYRNKIYLNTTLSVAPDSVAPVKLLIDTGAGLPLLLFSDTHPMLHPPENALSTNIGMGLGGFLQGFTGRINGLQIGEYNQNNIITYFQTLDTLKDHEYLNKRNGLIGNVLLSRFQVVLDYRHSLIWIKPAKKYRQEYVYDRSGLTLIASGQRFTDIVVQSVLPNSPAEEAGIRRGDEIMSINGRPVSVLGLANVQRAFQKDVGKTVKIKLKREKEKIKKEVVLRNIL